MPSTKPLENKNRSVFLLVCLFKIRSLFEYIFGPTRLGFWLQKSPKKRKIPIPRGIIKLINFGTDFSSIFAAFWKPSWTHVGHLSRPKTAQEASKTISRRLQDDPKSAPRSNTTWADGVPLFWSPLGLDFGASRPRF